MANSKELTEQVMELHKKQTEEMKALEEQREEALKVEKYDEAAVELHNKVNDLSERVVMVEQSTKSAHHRLDRYEEEEIYHGKPRKRWWV